MASRFQRLLAGVDDDLGVVRPVGWARTFLACFNSNFWSERRRRATTVGGAAAGFICGKIGGRRGSERGAAGMWRNCPPARENVGLWQ
ncbi:unnamed protein product [Urochloa humidicola]